MEGSDHHTVHVVNTRDQMAKVDGRFAHWLRGLGKRGMEEEGEGEDEGEGEEGEPKVEQQPGVRYSLIFYSTESANATPRSLPVYDDWAPTAAEGNTTSNITADR